MTGSTDCSVVVIGAGMAGLTCAQALTQAGLRVVVLEKSRGVGGRIATRRLYGTCADHGTCYLTPKGDRFRRFLEPLIETGVVQAWTDTVHEMDEDGRLQSPSMSDRYPRYVAPAGMTAIAKSMTDGLDIYRGQRVEQLEFVDGRWNLTAVLVSTEELANPLQFVADAVVVAIPAPQAVMLLQPLIDVLSAEFLSQLRFVQFLPCLSTIAGYPAERQAEWYQQFPDVRAITFTDHSTLGWVGLDSSKRAIAPQPVFVVQSSAEFANAYLDAPDLQIAGQHLLKAAAQQLASWLATPEWLQVHRWRYAFAQAPLADAYFAATSPAPLVCAGEWCGGRKVEDAYESGLAAAEYVIRQLKKPN